MQWKPKPASAKLSVYKGCPKPVLDVLNRRCLGHCERCGTSLRPGWSSTHHRRNVSQGGEWSVVNCVRLCGDGKGDGGCHGWAGTHPAEARAQGWCVRSTEDPAKVAVDHVLHGLVLLLPDGGFGEVAA
jgi:hypothetical protein